MRTPRDTLTIRIVAAQKRRDLALQRVAAEEAAIADLMAKKRAQYTRELRRKGHWPHRQSPAARALDALLAQEQSL